MFNTDDIRRAFRAKRKNFMMNTNASIRKFNKKLGQARKKQQAQR